MKTDLKRILKLFSILILFFISILCRKIHFRTYNSLLNRIYVQLYGGRFIDTQNVIFQEEENDCGIAALAMILKHFDITKETKYLRKKARLSDIGMTMAMCAEIAKKEGLKVKALYADWGILSICSPPLLTLVKNSHYVIIDKVDSNRIIVRDPAVGRVIYPKTTWEKIWNGRILIFEKQ